MQLDRTLSRTSAISVVVLVIDVTAAGRMSEMPIATPIDGSQFSATVTVTMTMKTLS